MKKNPTVTAAKKATGKVGGSNAAVKAQKVATGYKGGKNAGAIPKKGQGR